MLLHFKTFLAAGAALIKISAIVKFGTSESPPVDALVLKGSVCSNSFWQIGWDCLHAVRLEKRLKHADAVLRYVDNQFI